MLYPWIRVAYRAMVLVTNMPVFAQRSARCSVTLQLVSEREGRDFESSLVHCLRRSLAESEAS